MAPPLSALLLALLPLVSGLPDPSPSAVAVPMPDKEIHMENSWVVVWKQEADEKTIAARQAEFATTLKKRSLGKRDENGNPLPMDSQDVAIGNFRATFCNTDPETMNIMVSSAAAQVDWVEPNPKVSAFQAGAKKAEPPPPQFDFQEAAAASKQARGPQGNGTVLYALDTGINVNHTVFENRAQMLANLVPGEPAEDLNGHGTHTASSAVGLGVGVAPQATFKGVKVLGAEGGGSGDAIAKGLQAACQDVKNNLQGKCAVNMSLGTARSQMVNDAVKQMGECGCGMFVAAGNSDEDAARSSPASSPDVITICATDARTNKIAKFSNRGKDVDICANGVNVIGADAKDINGFKDETGTSMSSPQIAGKGLNALSTGEIRCSTDCTAELKRSLQKEAEKEEPIDREPGALETLRLQLNTTAESPVDEKGPTPVGAGAKQGGASSGGTGAGKGGKKTTKKSSKEEKKAAREEKKAIKEDEKAAQEAEKAKEAESGARDEKAAQEAEKAKEAQSGARDEKAA